ncbi:MAG: biotin--[acetyl-CoA-carboxylase] ligase [Fibrobacter sp.]|nr:biotin--[acetyl-CoA-carboxylase] ligase [Fibrobacter sp.]
MEPDDIKRLPFVSKFISFQRIDSTNSFARGLKELPSEGITVVQAQCQNSGRGRMENTFFSDHPGGLWVSIISPISDLSKHFSYNRAISLAITDTVIENCTGAPIATKWPNDIYWADKKICGILLENHLTEPGYLVIGFGLNVNLQRDDFPSELCNKATSLLAESGRTFSAEKMLSSILTGFFNNLSADQHHLHSKYLSRLYRQGARVRIEGIMGKLETVEPDGRLLVQTNEKLVSVGSGTLHFVN